MVWTPWTRWRRRDRDRWEDGAWHLHPKGCSLFAGVLLKLPWQAAKSIERMTSLGMGGSNSTTSKLVSEPLSIVSAPL